MSLMLQCRSTGWNRCQSNLHCSFGCIRCRRYRSILCSSCRTLRCSFRRKSPCSPNSIHYCMIRCTRSIRSIRWRRRNSSCLSSCCRKRYKLPRSRRSMLSCKRPSSLNCTHRRSRRSRRCNRRCIHLRIHKRIRRRSRFRNHRCNLSIRNIFLRSRRNTRRRIRSSIRWCIPSCIRCCSRSRSGNSRCNCHNTLRRKCLNSRRIHCCIHRYSWRIRRSSCCRMRRCNRKRSRASRSFDRFVSIRNRLRHKTARKIRCILTSIHRSRPHRRMRRSLTRSR